MRTLRKNMGRLAVGVVLFAIVVGACGPNVHLDVSSCMNKCAEGMKSCLIASDAELSACDPADSTCQQQAIDDKEKCMEDEIDCVDRCVAAAERQINGS